MNSNTELRRYGLSLLTAGAALFSVTSVVQAQDDNHAKPPTETTKKSSAA